MYGLIEEIWETHTEKLVDVAKNLCLGTDTPNDRLTVIFIAAKCSIISLDANDTQYIDQMMQNNASTGHVEGRVTSAMDMPGFVTSMF